MDHFDITSVLGMLGGLDQTLGVAGDSILIKGLPSDEYHADRDALSCSMLKPLLISPAHFQASLATLHKSSEAKDFGTLLHMLILEPHALTNQVAFYPGVANRRTKAYEEFETANAGKLIVDEPTFAEARLLADKVMSTKFRGRPVQRFIEESICEATIYFTDPDTGLRMRVRLDSYHPDFSFDLKSTRHAILRAFAASAVELSYDLQAFMYSVGRCLYEGSAPKPFVFIAAETDAPYSVSLLTASNQFLANGARKFKACITAFKACTDLNHWPDLSGEAELDLEPWQQFDGREGWRSALGSSL